jgi:hypothetical protein
MGKIKGHLKWAGTAAMAVPIWAGMSVYLGFKFIQKYVVLILDCDERH